MVDEDRWIASHFVSLRRPSERGEKVNRSECFRRGLSSHRPPRLASIFSYDLRMSAAGSPPPETGVWIAHYSPEGRPFWNHSVRTPKSSLAAPPPLILLRP